MNKQQYQEFLVSRVFAENGFGTVPVLLAAIASAVRIQGYSERREALFAIARLAPMRDDVIYLTNIEDFPKFLAQEVAAYEAARQPFLKEAA